MRKYLVIAEGSALKIYDSSLIDERKKFVDNILKFGRSPNSDDKNIISRIIDGDFSMFQNPGTGLLNYRCCSINMYLGTDGEDLPDNPPKK